jgi:endonuclease/exonuclease/phosphatase family metal-dependent hydrolase
MSFNFPTTSEDMLTQIGTDLHIIKNDNDARIKSAKSIIKSYDPDIIGFQETHREDIHSLCASKHIGDLYAHYAPCVGEHGQDKNALFFKKNNFNIVGKGIIYLNEKQEKDCNSWDDKHERACAWLCLQHKVKKTIFFIYNTHLGLAHESIVKGSKLIAETANKSKSQQVCSFIIGDFNAASGELNYLTKDPYSFINIRRSTPPEHISGPEYTYTGYDNKAKETPDHIYGTLPNAFKSIAYATITDKPHNTRPSDHYPIMATLQLMQ